MTAELLREIKRIAEELATFPFVRRTWTDLSHEHGLRGNAAGGHANIVAGCAGAPVYHDIKAEGGVGTRTDVRNVADLVIQEFPLRTESERTTARAIEFVALGRLGLIDVAVSTPALPADAGDYYQPTYRPIRLAAPPTTEARAAANVARYLRIHAKTPYARASTILWMVDHAREHERFTVTATADGYMVTDHRTGETVSCVPEWRRKREWR